MLRIKRMDRFMLQNFLPLLLMTFFICLFIVLMQFLWRFIDDLVGKGLGVDVIAELFFYAALTMVPMALPLAVLLASLMTFGNLGEQFELTAIKAAGVSLLRAMAPLTVLMLIIATGAFFFQNDVLPVAQTKMWTLLYSMRQKSPELEIPEGVFYDQIPGYNLYVESKSPTGTLYDMMIYDSSRGFDNQAIIVADSGRISLTPDKTQLILHLWQGESFENLKDAASGMHNVPYRRESFSEKEITLRFDANFNRMDEQGMRSQYVGKNIAELRATIDSVGERVDSMGTLYGRTLVRTPYFSLPIPPDYDTLARRPVAMAAPVDLDSVFRGSTSGYGLSYLNQALIKAQRMKQEYEFKAFTMTDDLKSIRRHSIELQKKFTLSFACIIFFFIGAPLGAIIRKGGIGTPLVISVFLFIFYYIIDNTGYKLARDGKWEVWQGIWLSTAVLIPLGVFFTVKATGDSAVFDKDAYRNRLRRLVGIRENRTSEYKEIVMEETEPVQALHRLETIRDTAREILAQYPHQQNLFAYWLKGIPRPQATHLRELCDDTAVYLSNTRSRTVAKKIADIPVLRDSWLIDPTAGHRLIGIAALVCLPLGVAVWLFGRMAQKATLKDCRETIAAATELSNLIETHPPTKTD